MKRFSAQYIITNSGPPLKRAVVTTEDDGTIISIEDTAGDLKENHSIEFYNGIIIPGFVVLEELKKLQFTFPEISIDGLIFRAASNGARAQGKEYQPGKIEPGKKPRLLLLQNVDLINLKLLPESFVTRLI